MKIRSLFLSVLLVITFPFPSLAQNNAMLDVPLIKQNPELRYGCEVTSLAMMLQFAGVQTNKMDLYNKIKKDNDPIVKQNGDIIRWGDPDEGFVGDMTGRSAGYAVFDGPIINLINAYLPGKAVNLTNKSFSEIEAHVAKGFPVVVWTTGDYRLPDRPESWMHGNKKIITPLDLHAVVLVGFDQSFVYLNDPLSGRKQVKVNKQQFLQSWHALKNRAVSYQ
ncbi:C39 family peptidase [Robertmurraya korlensis]|uniref:C39 family peptidase n=1 Tax=Robertmurraya korlensis TaxID=519977 RepID=UPI000A01CA83|nr:C39 family peptidase [Robertmurraya korlensis]